MKQFNVWLEFETVAGWENTTNNFANIEVDTFDGQKYALNVWTFDFLKTAVNKDIERQTGGKGLFLKPPDLFVKELTRLCIVQTISELLAQGDLDVLLNESIYGLKFMEPWVDVLKLNDYGESLKNEIQNEISFTHQLYGQNFEILATRHDNHNILIELDNNQLAMIQLATHTKSESGEYPLTEFFLNKKDFWNKKIKVQ